MNHEPYQQRISLYVDNALNDKDTAKLFAHLARCTDCRAFMKSTVSVHAHIAEEELAEVPLSLDRRVLASVATASDQSERRPWYAPMWFTRISIPLPAAASILFLIIVGSLLFSPILAQEPQHQTEIPASLMSRIPASLQR
jgi:anti-sigma factor RsiW